MNLFDVVVILLAIAAAIGGYRLGFLARAVSWIGLGLGIYVAARFLPAIIERLNPGDPAVRLLVAFVILIGGALIGQALGLLAGARLHRALPLGPIRDIDRGVGAGIGALGVLVALWLLLPSISAVPGWPAREADTSAISGWVHTHFPKAPNALQVLKHIVGPEAFPDVFNALRPGVALGPPPASAGLSQALVNHVSASTVKVQGQACDEIQDGSGFAVGDNLIATNAHVVAGEGPGRTKVLLPDGSFLPATVVLFDPNRDLSLLEVPGLGETPLPIGSGQIGEVVGDFGHPNGQNPLALAPAEISQKVTAVGQNLYDTHNTSRSVFILSAVLYPGDSGSPLVDSTGSVVGVAFAIDPDQSTTAYALASSELQAVLSESLAGAVSTGPCLS